MDMFYGDYRLFILVYYYHNHLTQEIKKNKMNINNIWIQSLRNTLVMSMDERKQNYTMIRIESKI